LGEYIINSQEDGVKPEKISLVIDVFTPSTLPMSRLAEYLKPFAAMIGSEAYVHFNQVGEGSAVCEAYVDPHAAPKVRERISGVVAGTAPKGAMRAHLDIDSLLRNDNAIGHVEINARNVMEFPGRRRGTQERIGPVRRSSSIEGQIYSIGGKDETINVYLHDGQKETKCVVTVELARKLGTHLRGPRIRFFGQGLWHRVDGEWEMTLFNAESFIPLDDAPLDRTLKSIQANLSGIDPHDLLTTIQELREG
jgi:hypothetical protein